MDLHDLRARRLDYDRGSLDDDGPLEPFALVEAWLADALAAQEAGELFEATAMTLSTVRELADGSWQPESRVVLLKSWSPDGFVFFTNNDSAKGRALAATPRAALHFHWAELHRQLRVEGVARPVERAVSEEYFAMRPRGSQLGAWASRQSATIPSRDDLRASVDEAERRFEGGPVPCPPFWGGYVVVPERLEFWQGRPSRLHDRLVFTRAGQSWERRRLAP